MNRFFILMIVLAALVGLVMTSNTTHAEEPPIIGDADCSGEVTARDAQFVLRAAVGLPLPGGDNSKTADCVTLGDVNCDTSLDVQDALLILRFNARPSVVDFGECVIGQPVPDFEEGQNVVSEEPLLDDSGKQIGTVVVVGEASAASGVSSTPSGVSTLAADYYWSCRSGVYAKNSFGMKVFTLTHYQAFRYNGSRVTLMYTPYMTSSTMPGWSMHDPATYGPYNYGWVGTSQSTATFKYMNVPWFGSLQSYRVTVGTYVYGSGYCYPWGAW